VRKIVVIDGCKDRRERRHHGHDHRHQQSSASGVDLVALAPSCHLYDYVAHKKEAGSVKTRVGILVGAIVLSGAQLALGNPPGTKLTADQIRQQLVDHTTYGTISGRAYVQYVAPDGTQKIKMANFTDSGTYRITSDGVWCRTWKISTGGKEDCVTVYKDGDTYYSVTPDGGIRATYTVQPGNPDHL
jgi:hypothetical protein